VDEARPQAFSVLVVDDDEGIRDSLCTALEDAGYSSAAVGDGAAALEWLEAHPSPGVILLDLQMPVMDGLEFRARQRVHPRLAAVPVIVCTAARASDELVCSLGSALFMTKPFDLDRLLEAIEELLDR
jgi:CheY-like chemotaxis protein